MSKSTSRAEKPIPYQEREDMIDQKTVLRLKNWFSEYVGTFKTGDSDYQQNIILKEEHSMRVCSEILDVGKSLGLSEKALFFAEVTALFHDVGRFEQYKRYGTFLDLASENHAALGVRVLKELNVLEMIEPSARDMILRVVLYHNRAELPEDETEECLFFARLLRDADKLDIYRVVTDHYGNTHGPKNRSIELDLPDVPEVSDEVCRALLVGEIARAASIKTLNDFKLLQMGWVYDLNFPRTYQLVRERGYIEMIRDVLPQTEVVLKIYSKIKNVLETNCTG
jgi:hypothetical protein